MFEFYRIFKIQIIWIQILSISGDDVSKLQQRLSLLRYVYAYNNSDYNERVGEKISKFQKNISGMNLYFELQGGVYQATEEIIRRWETKFYPIEFF